LRGVGARGDLEVVFELPLLSVENQIDAGVNLFITYAGKLRNVGTPLRAIVTDEVIALALQKIGPATRALGLAPASFMRTDSVRAAEPAWA